MTRDKTMRLAREAGLDSMPPDQNYRTAYMAGTEDEWERFAALVAAAERKACQELAISLSWKWSDARRLHTDKDVRNHARSKSQAAEQVAEAIAARGEQ